MAREYFPHDFHARSELRDICMRFGMEGYGFYWGFVEILHESGGYIKESELEAIAFELRVSVKLCNAVVKESGFFVVKKGKVTSDRVLRNLKKRAQISEARREAVNKRWKGEEDEKSPSDDESPSIPPFERKEDESSSPEIQRVLEELHVAYYSKSIDEWKPWFEEQFDHWLDYFAEEDAEWEKVNYISNLFMNLLDELRGKSYVTVNRKKVHVNDYLCVMQFFFLYSQEGHGALRQVVEEVNEKCRAGRVKNKQNYLISALYNAVKMNGGH